MVLKRCHKVHLIRSCGNVFQVLAISYGSLWGIRIYNGSRVDGLASKGFRVSADRVQGLKFNVLKMCTKR